MGNTFSYMRISTKEERQRQRYSRQEAALQRYATEHHIEYLMEFKEDISGKNFTDRKEWQKLESIVKEGDAIIFKDISRFTREREAGYQKYTELMNKGVDLIFIDNPTVSTPYVKKMLKISEEQDWMQKSTSEFLVSLLIRMELDRVEKERTTLIQRTKDGLAASSKKSGRAVGKLDKLTPELRRDINIFLKDRNIKYTHLMSRHKVSRNTLKKYIELVRLENEQADKKNNTVQG